MLITTLLASLTTTGSGKMTEFGLPPFTSYSASKAGLNMLGLKMSEELKEKKVAVVMQHPGYVMTDMNKADPFKTPKFPPMMPEESVSLM